MDFMRRKRIQNIKMQVWAYLAALACGALAVYNAMITWEAVRELSKLWMENVQPHYEAIHDSLHPKQVVDFIYIASAIVIVCIWMVLFFYLQSRFEKQYMKKKLLSGFSMTLGIQCLALTVFLMVKEMSVNQRLAIAAQVPAAPPATAVLIQAFIFALLGIGGIVVSAFLTNRAKRQAKLTVMESNEPA